jgi:hypothetical protein
MLEFRHGNDGQEDWLVEINPRLWGSISLPVHAGLDFPWWHFRYFALGETPVMPEQRTDVSGCRYLTAEAVRLWNIAKGPPAGWREPYPPFGSACRDFLAAFGPGWKYYHQSVADPLPGLAEPLTFLRWNFGRGSR